MEGKKIWTLEKYVGFDWDYIESREDETPAQEVPKQSKIEAREGRWRLKRGK